MAGPERVLTPRTLVPQAPAGFLTAPFQFLLTGEDGLRLSAINFAGGPPILQLSGRWLPAGATAVTAFTQTLTPTTDGSETGVSLALGAGALLNLTVIPLNAQVERGQCFVRVDVIRGTGATIVLGTLVAGFVGGWGGRSWPGTPLETPLDGPGQPVVSSAPAVGAGVDPVLVVGLNKRWRVMAVSASLLTSATVVNRTPELQIRQNGAVVARVQSNLDQGATLQRTHSFLAGGGNAVPPTTDVGIGALPTPLYLSACGGASDFRFEFVTANLQPGDQWSLMTVTAEQWPNPPTVFNAITPF